MIINGQKIQDNSEFNVDLCIIGAGAAGISIARTFNNLNVKVCLLESGGFDYSAENTKLYTGETSGIDEVFEVITGTPQAMASSIGIPKLSRNDGYKKMVLSE